MMNEDQIRDLVQDLSINIRVGGNDDPRLRKQQGAMATSDPRTNDDYEPTETELAEQVHIDTTPGELAAAVMRFKPPKQSS